MCWSRNSNTLSWLGILWGLMSLATLLIAFFSNVWLYTKEPIQFPNSNILTTVTFKIGLWKICPSLKLNNDTLYKSHLPCTAVKYSSWEDITATDIGILTPLEFTPSFLSKMRISTLFGAVSIILIFLATVFALFGLCNSDHKTIVACSLFILGGLTLGGGLLIFASVLSDAYFERPKRPHIVTDGVEKVTSSVLFDYKYGWSFFTAGAAFFMTELAAVLSISAYARRFPTVEDMVRIMVPGAERRLKHHGLAVEYLVQHKNKYQRQDPDTSVTLKSGSKCKSKVPAEGGTGGTEGAMFLNKPAPDICTSNPAALPESIISFGSPPVSSKVLLTPSATYCANPENAYILSEIGSVGADSVLSNSPLRDPLAGHTVPILLMHHSQRAAGTPFMLSTRNKDSKANFNMSMFPLLESTKKPDALVLARGKSLAGADACFDQSFYSNNRNEFEVSFDLQHLGSESGENEGNIFGTFQSERAFTPGGMLDRCSDVSGMFSTASSSSGTGSGTTVTGDSSQSNLSRKRDFAVRERGMRSATIGNVLNMETSGSPKTDVLSLECTSGLG